MKKRKVLNRKGEILTGSVLFAGLMLCACDCKSLIAFVLSKALGVALLVCSAELMQYIKEK